MLNDVLAAKIRVLVGALCLAAVLPATAAEEVPEGPIEVKIDENLPYVDVVHDGKTVRVQRIQDQENMLAGGFAKTSRKCPPFCVHPINAAPGVTTVGELELLQFVKGHVEKGTGLLIDARTPDWHQKGTIPGSINIPFTLFAKAESDPDLQETLRKFGVQPYSINNEGWLKKVLRFFRGLFGGDKTVPKWDFGGAKELLLWCNGPWCDQSPRAIKGLLKLGYPAQKLRYYRGGMQSWQILGLTVVVPGAELAP